MSFMKPEVTSKQRGWMVETAEGTWFVPGDLAPVPECFATDVDFGDGWIRDEAISELRQYVARDPQSVQVCDGYFVRLSASGYLDRTEWSFCRTKREVSAEIRRLQGDE